jgi:hypothetical protein
LTIRNMGGKSAAVTRGHMNTMKIVRPALHPGKFAIAITNPEGRNRVGRCELYR